VKPTAYGALFLPALLAAAGIAVWTGTPAAAACACALLAVAGWSYAAARAARRTLAWRWSAPSAAFAGERIAITWSVENRSAIFPLRIEAAAVESPRGTTLPSGFAVAPGAERRLLVRIPVRRRGEIQIGPAVIRATGIPPLWSAEVRSPERIALTAYPRPAVLRAERVAVPAGMHERPHERASRAWMQWPEEFLHVREFLPGDPPRRIHWRASLRRPEPLRIREMAAPEPGEVTIALDVRRPPRPGLRWRADFERAVCAAAALLRHFSRRGWAVLIALGPQRIRAGPQLDPAYLALAYAEPSAEGTSLDDVEGTVFLVTPNDPPPCSASLVAFGPDDLRACFSYLEAARQPE
jgi:uncharacterized protein (DUF58 family)